MTRLLGVIVHNWPLKLAAVGLATLLYGGLVLSQSAQEYRGVIQVDVTGQPADTYMLSAVEPVTVVRYFAASGATAFASTFTATADVSGVTPGAGPTRVPIVVTSLDDRITVLGSTPDAVTVELDALTTVTVPVQVERGTVPAGIELGETTVTPPTVRVSGPSTVVRDVVAARADVRIQPGGIDVDEDVRLVAVDSLGEAVSPVSLDPATARVIIPVFSDRQSRTLPVSPVVTGTPAAGFEIAGVSVEPSVITVEGDADELVELERIDTVPVPATGLSSDTTMEVALAMPTGVVPLDRDTVAVTIRVRQVTATRNFEVGLALAGASPELIYEPAVDRIQVTVGGSIADLDRLSGATLVGRLDVEGLAPGTHRVTVSVDLPAGLTFVGASPDTVSVVIREPEPAPTPTPTPAATPGPSPTPSPTPGA